MNNYNFLLKIIIPVLFLECSAPNKLIEVQQSKIEIVEEKLGDLKEWNEIELVLLSGQKIKGKYISFENEILFLREINDSQTEKKIRKIPLKQIATLSILAKKIGGFQLFIGATLFAVIVSFALMSQAFGQRL